MTTENGGSKMPTPDMQIVREKARFLKTGLSRVQTWRLEREGKHPRRVQLGPNSVGWINHELDQWIEEKAAARR
ncbi:MAG: AlpA family phage regulatory protein [Nitrospirales bacterium]